MAVADAKQRALGVLADYWSTGAAAIAALPVRHIAPVAHEPLPPRLIVIPLPEWAHDVGVGGNLLVPGVAVAAGLPLSYTAVDWWYAAVWYLDAHAERAWEAAHGPAHSYAARLRGWDGRQWDHAWVNRIAMFVRRWAAQMEGLPEDKVCGPAPRPDIRMTHDVDAVVKTVPIRLKQAAFKTYNAVRALLQSRPARAWHNACSAVRFLFGAANYWQLPEVVNIERQAGLRSRINLFAGRRGRPWNPARWLLDPSYNVAAPGFRQYLRSIAAEGWIIGLHPSFYTWSDPSRYQSERQYLEKAIDQPVWTLRQHWLRFSWQSTWQAQRAAGFTEDTSLAFNDRPGFRCGAAWNFTPLDHQGQPIEGLDAWPMVLMDSHLHDYGDLTPEQIAIEIDRWIREIVAVGGRATLVWHQRVMHPDYGWAGSFRMAVEHLRKLADTDQRSI